MTTLRQLLTPEEIEIFEKPYMGQWMPLDHEVKHLSLDILSKIGLQLIRTEYGEKVPACTISAETINILTLRAIKLDLSIF